MLEKEVGKLEDTIAAAATYPAGAAIGVIKISGAKALDIAAKVFLSKNKKNLKKVANYTLHYGWIKDKDKVVDEVLIGIMRAPNSYTRENVVEIYSHSGSFVLDRIINLVLSQGARLADPGEFTKRAYLSGRIDLVQAEAVMDIVNSTNEQALGMSVSQLKGSLSKKLQKIYQDLKEICVHLEADLSFPEDVHINKKKIDKDVEKMVVGIDDLLKYSDKAKLFRDGVRCVICGRPNVGKSSLLNMLLEEERVIVTSVAGTTRDVIEEVINIRGIPLRIYDTAGILRPRDLIEKKAIEKSYAKIEEADIVFLVLDSSRKLSREDSFLIEKVKDKKIIFVLNKIDLKTNLDRNALEKYKFPIIKISALKHEGLKGLENRLVKTFSRGVIPKDRDVFVSNVRHIKLLQSANSCLKEGLNEKELDVQYFNFNSALQKIAQTIGCGENLDILDSVFSEFCIGK